MYATYEFTFGGIPASLYGMFVADIGNKAHGDNKFGNKANIVEKRIANRITPLHYGVRYHDDPLRFSLIFCSCEEMDRYQLQEISNWLTGYQEYQWLSIDQPDMEHIQFRCLIEELTPISIGWYPFALEANVVCDCPYGYSYPFKQVYEVDGVPTKFTFYNDSTIREHLKPDLEIELHGGCENFSITNDTTGCVFQLKDVSSGPMTIIVDNENGVMKEKNGVCDPYDHFNFEFLTLASGDNHLEINGNATVTISGRYLYNVGA